MVLPDDRLPRARPDEPSSTPVHEDQPTAGLDGALGPTLAPTFLSGDVVADRFRIVRFIAEGGMGEVYEAEDRELREHVALKTVRPGIATDEAALERFRREVLLSRRVTHPNVCRIFDVFRHKLPDNRLTGEPGHDVVFLTMELLAGRTLTEQLRKHGPFSTQEALPLAEQMAGALGAAHQAGVTHRDFKSNNVVLEPARDGRVRAVVTDFGLADAASEGEPSHERDGDAVGTPAYMAPEQVDGSEVGPAADIYALGVVLYEMTTGRLPFIALTASAMATMRLRQAPTSPRAHRPDLDPLWEQTILRCLERDPLHRYASAEGVAQALRSGKVRPPARRRAPVALLVAGLLLAAGLGYWLTHRHGLSVGPLQSVQVTSSTGLDLFPAISPDGQRLAYSSDRTGRFELWLRGLAPGSHDQQLTTDGGQNFQPSWSPDGRALVYHSKVNGGLWVVPLDGGAPRRLTTFGSRPDWSPTGEWIAFQSDGLTDLAANAVAAMPPSTLWRVHRSGGEPLPITSAGDPPGGHGDPDWSPDESRVLFTASDRRDSSVWSATLEGKDVVRVSPPATNAYDPVHSPDGRRVYYSGITEGGSYGLFAMRLDGGHPRGTQQQLADFGLGSSRQLSLSRDGSQLAFSALRMSSNLWSLPMKGDEPAGEARALSAETGRNSRPAISPDGARLAFEKWQAGANPDVWVLDEGQSGGFQVTTDPAVDTVPSWDPSGERLVFRTDRGGRPAILSIGVKDRAEQRVAEVGPDMDWVRPSPDGRSLAYQLRAQGGSINLWRMELPAGRPRQITFDHEFAGFACWSPDGQWLAMQVKRGENFQIGVVPSAGGTPIALTNEEGQSWPYSWSPDGQQVAFAGFRAGFWNIYRVSRSTRQERALTHYSKLNAYVRYPAWSPRGDRIVYEYAETTGNVWLLKGLQ